MKFIGNNILLPSDRSGYMKLYVYNMNGQLMRTIGDGNYDITEVYGYDAKTGDVYYRRLRSERQTVRCLWRTRTARQSVSPIRRDGTRLSSLATTSTSSTHGATTTHLIYIQHALVRAR